MSKVVYDQLKKKRSKKKYPEDLFSILLKACGNMGDVSKGNKKILLHLNG